MMKSDLIKDITATYERHGWELKRVLLRFETKAEIANNLETLIRGAKLEDSSFDALWFSRPSHGGAEAWELRLVAETPYALFERIGGDETVDNRAELFSQMEERLAEYAAGSRKDEGCRN